MKKIFLIIVFTIITISCKAQNTINSDELTVNGIIVMGQNKSVLTSSFGQPLLIEKDFSEIDNVDMYIYKYNGVVFYVINDLIDDYEITNNNYNFTKHNIKIGNNVSSLQNVFSLSYNKKSNEHISLWIKEHDKYVSIHFDKVSKIITKIRIGTY
jgi:hypothetical protein